MNSERRSIFVTGAASGMGRATARLFAKKGWFVGIYDINEKGLETLALEIGDENCHASPLDVTDRAAYQSVLREFDNKAGGRLDVLYNNAGIIKSGLFGDMDFADISRIIGVNLMGIINGIHLAYPMLKNTPNSLCFTTSSSSAIYGSAGLAAYSASKHAVKGLTEALSVEFALIDSRAADTLPGHIETGMMDPQYGNNLPKEGPWRLIPAEAVADVVWASYQDETGKLHWYVPDDLEPYNKRVADDIEAERDSRIQQLVAHVESRSSEKADQDLS
jgi:NAD(P)-dependent dehydrogenase (short-subunit alcohol dehydrogenase family)